MNSNAAVARIGIVTVSDRAARGEYEDRGGPAINDYFREVLTSPWEPVARVIPDEQPLIEQTIIELCDVERCALIVTTGGTGPARARHHARSDRTSLPQAHARLRRTDAGDVAENLCRRRSSRGKRPALASTLTAPR